MSIKLRPAPRKCAWCQNPCTHLCDYPVRAISTTGERPDLCKLPICTEHATSYDGGRDLCPTHQELEHPGTVEERTASGRRVMRRHKVEAA